MKNINKILKVFLVLLLSLGFVGNTFATAPGITTDSATSVGLTSITLNGTITSSIASSRGFEYGLTASYGTTTTEVNTSGLVNVLSFGSSGSGNGQFIFPKGAAIDSSGNIYLVDNYNNRVQKFDSSGNYVSKFGTTGSGNGQFSNPFGIALDSNNNIYVADADNNRVQKFDSSGNYVSKFGTTGSGNGQFSNPRWLAIDSSDNIYVADINNSRVQKFNSSGVYQLQFGTAGFSGAGTFFIPNGIAFDSSGNIYVSDSSLYIQKFNSSGVYQSQFGGVGGFGNGQFNNISGITIDSSGNIYVADNNNRNIQKFNSSGVYITQYSTDVEGGIYQPFSLSKDSLGNLYITSENPNSGQSRIHKFTNNAFDVGAYTANISSLNCGTTYHYRAYATNASGTSYGSDDTFTTSACVLPTVTSSSASSVTASTATLNGNITNLGGINNTTRGFEYGLTTGYGLNTVENGSFSTGTYTAGLTSLSSCSTYHYRAYTTNPAGTSYSSDDTFSTNCSPTVSKVIPLYVSSTSTTLYGYITDTAGSNATIRGFEYGPTASYGTDVPETGDFGTGSFSATLTGLTNGTTYHYRAYATNTVGTTYTADKTFVAGVTVGSISLCADFEAINNDLQTLDGSYILTTDLDCTSEGNAIIVGTTNPFTGTFDGNNHTITINITSGDHNGLFSRGEGSSVSNLNIAGNITGDYNLGSLFGYLENDPNQGIVNISNVHSTVNIIGNNASYIGGLIGEIYNDGAAQAGDTTAINITNSSYTGDISGGTYYVAGLIGYIEQGGSASMSITNSYAEGDISGNASYIGGLIGEWDSYDGDMIFTGNHYSGNVDSSDTSRTSGLIGRLYINSGGGYEEPTITISDNYSTGTVLGSSSLGGLVGDLEVTNDQDFPMTINFENNYSTINITPTGSNSAGLIGDIEIYNNYSNQPITFNFNQNYYTGTITNAYSSGGLIGYFYIDGQNFTTILSENYSTGTFVNSGNYSAGLIGTIESYGDEDITISDSYFSGNITATGYVGGLVSSVYMEGSNLNINRSYAKGSITGSNPGSSARGGGLIGEIISVGVNITDSFSAAEVSSFNTEYGALVGYSSDPFTTTNVYFDQTTAGGIECVNDGVNTGCTAVNTVGSPDATYFKSNHTNAPLDNWNFSTIWRNKVGVNGNYPVLQAFTVADAVAPTPIPTPSVTTSTSLDKRISNLREMGKTKEAKELENQFPNLVKPTTTIPVLTTSIKQGKKNSIEQVKILQNILGLKEDGKFGPKTIKSVKEFQKKNGLKPDGIVGPKTWALINSLKK